MKGIILTVMWIGKIYTTKIHTWKIHTKSTKGAQRKKRRKKERMEIINELSNKVIGCAIEVHKGLGPGLLESAYQECLFYKLNKSGYFTEKQKALPLIFEDVKMDVGYRIDLMVEGILIIEIKAVDKISDIHISQLATYLKLSKCKLGLLLNFNVILLKDGIKRVIN